jgi:hypothetical protein
MDLFQTHSETMEISLTEPRELVAQGDRVLVVGFARGRIKDAKGCNCSPHRTV